MRYGLAVTVSDFAAAQQRIAARRAQRALEHRNHHGPSRSARALSRLPFPLSSVSSAGFTVWDAIKGRSGTRPEFRVGQVDAELLDEELLTLLKDQVAEGLKYFGSHVADNYAPEILLVLRAILWKLSIWDQNASYGAHLQGLRYTDARSSAPNRPPPKPWQKIAYGVVTVGGRYAWTKWEDYLLSASEDYTRPESARLTFMGRLSELAGNAHDVLGLASFLVFLVDGRYRTITDRLLRLRLTPSSHSTSREVSFEYLNRQLVWHAFTEFLLFLLPLVGISRWRRILARTLKKLRAALLSLMGRSPAASHDSEQANTGGELGFLPERTCAICYRDQNPTSASEADIMAASAGAGGVVGSAATDITNPYEATSCGCIYCFACLAQRIANEEGEGWTCLRCGETIKECQPWTGDIIQEQPRTAVHPPSSHPNQDHDRPNTAKSVGFATADTPATTTTTKFTPNTDDTDDSLDEKASLLREIDPMPDHHHQHAHGLLDTSHTRGLNLGESLFTESSEWARASEDRSDSSSSSSSSSSSDGRHTSDDEHSEEYDEDEEEEGEELEAL
ncbi:peroxisome assembly protein (Peroxin-2) [Exserohilum turcicum]